jgi:hypothetical protein
MFHASFNVVATAYFLAATDVIVTSLLLLAVFAIAVFDPDIWRLRHGRMPPTPS